MRSFLRWAGSKPLLLGRLKSYWPGGARRYIEPFCGSARLFFDLEPEIAVLGDVNEELLYALRAIRSDPHLVLESCMRFPKGKSGYYRVRAMSPRSLASAERAARFLYLNRYCFNGIYRTNLGGVFNVPYGPPKSGLPVDAAVLVEASRALQNATLMHGDFEQTLEYVSPGDFVYLDPPYCVNSRRVFAEYGTGSFAVSDLSRLKKQLLRVHELKAIFVVSYADCTEARELLRPWSPLRIRTRRHIAGFSDKRRSAYELIATNCSMILEKEL